MKIVVVCGGFSSEREISLKSGKAVYEALSEFGYGDVHIFDMNKNNIAELPGTKADVVFLALHGKGGEDGSIQGLLELAQIPYTGSGIAASAVCMNKLLTKKLLVAADIQTAKYIELHKEDWEAERCKVLNKIVDVLGGAVVVKAPSEGSSIGVVISNGKTDIAQAIDEVFQYDDVILIEEYLEGIELTVPVMGNRKNIKLLPIIEIATERKFYDYSAKYSDGGSKHIIPANIDDEIRMQIEKISRDTYLGIGCAGIARIDFIVSKRKGPMVIEVNTLPGMTKTSLVPDAAKAAGMTFPELCSRLIMLALGKDE